MHVEISRMQQPSSDNRKWYVLYTYNPEDSEVLLRSQYRCLSAAGEPPFKYFVPYTFLSRHQSIELPDNLASQRKNNEVTRSVGKPEEVAVTRNREQVKRNNETRSALRRYLFVYANLQWLMTFLGEKWNSGGARIYFMSSKPLESDSVPESSMESFIHGLSALPENLPSSLSVNTVASFTSMAI